MSDRLKKPTPVSVTNRSGLSEISTRYGRHPEFLASLHRGLADANRPGLSGLRTQENKDYTLALLDGWASVCDTLTFYAERSANELYLRTATERLSVRAHARRIGYEMSPAKAASVFLAFIAEADEELETTLNYEPGIQVRSIPRDDELPQVFETVEPLHAREQWNEMRPKLHFPQELDTNSDPILLTPDTRRLSRGDVVLFRRGQTPIAYTGSVQGFLRKVISVSKDDVGDFRIDLSHNPVDPPYVQEVATTGTKGPFGPGLFGPTVYAASWKAHEFAYWAQVGTRNLDHITRAINALPPNISDPILPATPLAKVGFFGHNAVSTTIVKKVVGDEDLQTETLPSPDNIDDTAADVGGDHPTADKIYVYLEREVDEITPNSTALIRNPLREVYVTILATETVSVEAYGISARVTRLELSRTVVTPSGDNILIPEFKTRDSTLYAAFEVLPLADIRIKENIGSSADGTGVHEIELDRADLHLARDQRVAITGERADLRGVEAAEIRTIADSRLINGYTVLQFTQPLAHEYVRDTVKINANIAEATHGETQFEVLGDGNAQIPFQSFALKAKPLTYVSARTPIGMAPALEVRVNNIRWDRVDNFRDVGPNDTVYTVSFDEEQTAWVTFGDGETGRLVDTGLENVTAITRRGAGLEGLLRPNQLSLLGSKPQGLKGVTNPLGPSAAAESESIDSARLNASHTIKTLGRLVSLQDYEDFARGFSGIAKARADWTFDGYDKPIFVTVAAQGGVLLSEEGRDFTNLRDELRCSGESGIRVTLRNYTPAFFGLSGLLRIDPAYEPDHVKDAAVQALLAAFSFDSRSLGQSVSRAQVFAELQGVPGVIGVDLDSLHRIENDVILATRLGAAVATPSRDGKVPVPAELLIIERSAIALEIES